MEDTDLGNLSETLNDQYDLVKAATTKSPVLQFGDLSFEDSPISDFEADLDDSKMDKLFNKAKQLSKQQKEFELVDYVYYTTLKQHSVVSSRDASLHHLTAKVMEDNSAQNHLAL